MKPSNDAFFAPVACVRPPLQNPTLQIPAPASSTGMGAAARRVIHFV